MTFSPQLRIPGPTPLPERVVRAQGRPMIDHRGPQFAALLEEISVGARRVFETDNDLLVFTSSGSGGLESAVANLVSPGDQVVAAICGNFGERFAGMAAAYGADVTRLEAEWGQPVDPDDLARVLEATPGAKVVLLTHNETSTGLANDIGRLSRVARDQDRIVVVDGVSSVSSIRIGVDEAGIDVAVSASQKGWMAPPGIAFVTVSRRAWELQARSRGPKFYWDWTAAREFAEKGATPFTPAISVLYAVREGIQMLEEEGLERVYKRHRRLADATEAGLQALGFALYAAPGFRSATVTSALPPEGLDVAALRKLLENRYGVVIAGGQGKMTGKMIRVGHLGAVSDGDIVQVLWAVEQALEELDVAPADGRGLAAATSVLAEQAAIATA